MTELARPDPRLHESWAECVRDYADLSEVHGSGHWHLPAAWQGDLGERACREVVDVLLPYADPAHVVPDGHVHCDYFWITDGAPPAVVGFLAVRHRLTPALLEDGGNIGYSVRRARRGEGHANRALALAVRRAAELGIDRVLLTCDEDNEPSRRTIERNGGVYDDSRHGKRRYWIATGV